MSWVQPYQLLIRINLRISSIIYLISSMVVLLFNNNFDFRNAVIMIVFSDVLFKNIWSVISYFVSLLTSVLIHTYYTVANFMQTPVKLWSNFMNLIIFQDYFSYKKEFFNNFEIGYFRFVCEVFALHWPLSTITLSQPLIESHLS